MNHTRHTVLARRDACARALASLMLLATLSACAIGPQAREEPVRYDLGPLRDFPQANPGIRAVLLVPPVVAPAWIDGGGIVYRLAYLDAARPRTYAASRWADAPSALLTQRVRDRLAHVAAGVVRGGDGARADYALRMELEDFSQAFDAPDSSRAVVRARVTLIDLAGRALRAQRTFSEEQPARPDAQGGARGLSAASDALIASVIAWTSGILKDAGALTERPAK